MATKPTVTVIFLSLLFAVSHARFPLDLTENYVSTNEFKPVPESDQKITNTIFLPSEKPDSESESETVVELEPELTESKLPEISEGSTESETETVPLTVISFRPINRHFARRPMLPFRHSHGCRHSHQFKPWGPRVHNREIPYGNDMILSGDNKDLSSDPVIRGGERQIPARWTRFHHGGARFPFKHDVEGTEEMNRPHHHHHHHYHRHVQGEEHEHEHEHEHHEGGFMRKFREFLNQF